jgi:hypothetical protein
MEVSAGGRAEGFDIYARIQWPGEQRHWRNERYARVRGMNGNERSHRRIYGCPPSMACFFAMIRAMGLKHR